MSSQMFYLNLCCLCLCLLKIFLDLNVWLQDEHGKESPSMWTSACFLMWQLVFIVLPHVLHNQMSPSFITSSLTACFASAHEDSFSWREMATVLSVALVLWTACITSTSSSLYSLWFSNFDSLGSIASSVLTPYSPPILSLFAISKKESRSSWRSWTSPS